MENGQGALPAEFTYYGPHWDDSSQESEICAVPGADDLGAGSADGNPGWFSLHGRNPLSLCPAAGVGSAQGSSIITVGDVRREGAIRED